MAEPIHIDGSLGEGGGQVLRTALALSMVTGRPFRIERIRARRSRPGLRRQHLTAVRASALVSAARLDPPLDPEGSGNTLGVGAEAFTFVPGEVQPGVYRFAVGTAGSATLVLQTLLPPLMLASAPSVLAIEGGTHNPHAPPWDFLARVFLPLVSRMGPRVETRLVRPGFAPAGTGCLEAEIAPAPRLAPLELLERGPLVRRLARAVVARLPEHIARRELDTLAKRLDLAPEERAETCLPEAPGPGNAVMVELEWTHLTELFTGFGARGVPAERVAEGVAREVEAYAAAAVPVGPHLADQLLVPLALAGGGRFRTLPPTLHTRTNAEVIRRFLEVEIAMAEESDGAWSVAVGPRHQASR